MKQIKRKKLYEEIILGIEEMIKKNELKEGDKLQSEKELAATFGVSKMAVREALSALQSAGLIEVRHGSGIYLKNISDRIGNPLTLRILASKENMLHLLELRMGLETEGVYLAALRAEQSDLLKLDGTIDRMYEDITMKRDTSETDFQFHSAIIEATHNPLYIKVFEHIAKIFAEGLRTSQEYVILSDKQRMEVLEEHKLIINHIRNGEAEETKQVMREHLKKAGNNIRAIHFESGSRVLNGSC